MKKNLKESIGFKKKISVYLGGIGVFLIIFAQITNFLEIDPFVFWYVPILWYGYIFIIDGAVYSIKKNSYIMNRTKKFIVLII